MNAHFEAQTVLESLHWLAENQNQIDLPTALLIQAAEDPWSRVMEASKARTSPPAPAPAPAKILIVTLEPKQNAPQAKPEALRQPRRHRLAGM